jgi:glycosyltransferase involved in cell wall biosynthesis
LSRPLPPRPRVLAILPGLFASTLTLVVKPLLALHRAGRITADLTVEEVAGRGQVRRADVVVFCRNLEPAYDFLLQAARDLGKPIVYDLDDNLFDVPLETEEGRYYRDPARQAQFERYLRAAILVRVHARRLKARVAPYNPNVAQVNSPLYWDLVEGPAAPAAPGEPIKIVYMTSRMHDILSNIFVADALRILEHYGPQVELHCWGYHPPELRDHPRARLIRQVPNYDRYLRQFSRQGYDIGLAPLLDDEFHRAKTDTKFREYGACRVAGIYSNVEVYSSVTDEETGLLVANEPGAWYAAMARLIEDRPLRERIQAQAKDYVRAHYSPETFQAGWWEHLRGLLEAPPPAAPEPGGVAPARERPRPVRLARQAWSLVERLRRRGPAAAWYTLGWYWNNLWALLQLRWATSPLRERLARHARS